MFRVSSFRKLLDALGILLRHVHDFDFEVSPEFLRVVQFVKFIESFHQFPFVYTRATEQTVGI